MSNLTPTLPDDPALLKALIAALQAENAKISATLRAHDQLIQTLRLRIAKLKKQVFGQFFGGRGLGKDRARDLSDVSAHGTVLRDCVVEGLRFIFTPIGVEDDEEPKDRASETRDNEGPCRAGR